MEVLANTACPFACVVQTKAQGLIKGFDMNQFEPPPPLIHEQDVKRFKTESWFGWRLNQANQLYELLGYEQRNKKKTQRRPTAQLAGLPEKIVVPPQ